MEKDELIGIYELWITWYEEIEDLNLNNISDMDTNYKLKERLLFKIIYRIKDMLDELEKSEE